MKKYLLLIVAAVAVMTLDAQLVQVYKGDASSPVFTLADADSVVWAQQLPSQADTTAYDKAISLTWTATNYAMQYSTVVRDANKYYYIGMFEDQYYEEWIAGGGDDNGLNEAIIGWIEASYYYTYYQEITPYLIATNYCRKGNISSNFTALTRNTKYEVIAFYYDYENDVAGDVTYVWHVQTANDEKEPVYPSDMTIDLAVSGTNITATPSNDTTLYYFYLYDSATVATYTTLDEFAEAIKEAYIAEKGLTYWLSTQIQSKGQDTYSAFYECYYSSDVQTFIVVAFGVGNDGSVISKPVSLTMANPYYGSSYYDWSPARQAVAAEQKAAIARIYKDGVAKFVVANADSVVFTEAKVVEPLTFDVEVTNISDSSATIQVTPSDTTARYFWFYSDSATIAQYGSSVQEAAQYFMTNQVKAYIDEYNDTYSTEYTFYDFPEAAYRAYKGVDKVTFTNLSAQKEYMVIVFKATELCDVIDEPTSPLTVKTFRTEAKKD